MTQPTLGLNELRQGAHKLAQGRRDARKMRSDAHSFGTQFWERVRDIGNCWLWDGALNGEGYGSVGYEGRGYLAHRVAWELVYGPIPTGYDLHHRCRNPSCVKPSHLSMVSRSLHMRLHAGDYCEKGHPYTPRSDGQGRECRVCAAERQKANRERRNAQQNERRRRERKQVGV